MFTALNLEQEALPRTFWKNSINVEDYSFIQEKGRNRNRLFYYVVKIVKIRDDGNLICEWYELNHTKDSFRQKAAKWGVKFESLLCNVHPPQIFGEGHRQRLIFLKVYKFIMGNNYLDHDSK